MNAAAEQLACWLIMGKSERRSRRARRRYSARWRRHFRRLIVNLSFGFLLVGCAGQRPFLVAKNTVEDPIHVLRNVEEPNKRIIAYRQLGSQPEQVAGHEQLAGLLLVDGLEKEASPLARAAAARALKHYPLPEAREALRKATTDSSAMVRAEAATSLATIAGPQAIEVLGQLAKNDSDLDVRLAATKGLAQIKTPECNEYLLDCLLDRDIVVVEAAGAGLRDITGANITANYEAWNQYMASGTIPEGAQRIADTAAGGTILGKILR